MTTLSPQKITRLLADWGSGDASALDKLTPLVYAELPLVFLSRHGGAFRLVREQFHP